MEMATRMSFFSSIACAFALLSGCTVAEVEAAGGHEKFRISCFSFNKPAHTRQHVFEAKECGLNSVGGGIYPDERELMDSLHEAGIGTSVCWLPRVCGSRFSTAELRQRHPRESLEAKLDELSAKFRHPAIKYMNISDEPGVHAMEYLGDVVRLMNEKSPWVIPYINLYPNYAQASESEESVKKSQLGTTSYKKYIEDYCRLVPTTMISFDHYPIMATPEKTRKFSPRWYGNLKVVADACRRTGREMWVGPQANSRPKCAPISENSLRFQAFSAMAFGAVDLTWACWTMGWWDNNIMETNGTLTCQYQKLKTVNAEVLAFEPVYMRLRNVATHFIGFRGEEEALAKYEIVPVERLGAAGFGELAATDGSSLVVGEMEPRGGNSAVRGLFVFGANDCGDEKGETHEIAFAAKGAIRAFGPGGAVAVKRLGDGRFSVSLRDNDALLLLSK